MVYILLVYGDLHVVGGYVTETAMYHVPAICNDWGGVVPWRDGWHVPEAAMYHGSETIYN